MIPVTNYSDFAFYTELAVLILLLFWDSDFAYYTLAVLGGFNMDLWSAVSYQDYSGETHVRVESQDQELLVM